jgi:hypothetical protein
MRLRCRRSESGCSLLVTRLFGCRVSRTDKRAKAIAGTLPPYKTEAYQTCSIRSLRRSRRRPNLPRGVAAHPAHAFLQGVDTIHAGIRGNPAARVERALSPGRGRGVASEFAVHCVGCQVEAVGPADSTEFVNLYFTEHGLVAQGLEYLAVKLAGQFARARHPVVEFDLELIMRKRATFTTRGIMTSNPTARCYQSAGVAGPVSSWPEARSGAIRPSRTQCQRCDRANSPLLGANFRCRFRLVAENAWKCAGS